jgi:SAM-dependent methyltransferase
VRVPGGARAVEILACVTDAVDVVEGLGRPVVVLAALAAALGDERASTPDEAYALDPLRAAVLDGLGTDVVALLGQLWPERVPRSRAMASSLGQAAAAAAAGGVARSWAEQGDGVILAQGEASSATGRMLATRVVPVLDGLAARLADGGRILDVGTGIGALAVSLATSLPGVSVVGIDIAARPLALAADRVPAELAEHVTLRQADVLALDEADVYDLVWLPAPFLPAAALAAAFAVARRALRPGGWLVCGTRSPDTDAAAGARAERDWLASLTGGNAETAPELEDRLRDAGFDALQQFPTVPGGPILVAGRRPPAS